MKSHFKWLSHDHNVPRRQNTFVIYLIFMEFNIFLSGYLYNRNNWSKKWTLYHVWSFNEPETLSWTHVCSFPARKCVSDVQMSFWCLWTHQVIQHPHQRLKLQLANPPLVLATLVDVTVFGHIVHDWFVLLRVQHYQVVHTASTGDCIHLKSPSADRARSMWVSTDRWLTQHKIDREAFLSSNICGIRSPTKTGMHRDRLPDHCKRKTSFIKTNIRHPSI